jgi:hypothetical protein
MLPDALTELGGFAADRIAGFPNRHGDAEGLQGRDAGFAGREADGPHPPSRLLKND